MNRFKTAVGYTLGVVWIFAALCLLLTPAIATLVVVWFLIRVLVP